MAQNPKEETLLKELTRQEAELQKQITDLTFTLKRLNKGIESKGLQDTQIAKTTQREQTEKFRLEEERERIRKERDKVKDELDKKIIDSNKKLVKTNEEMANKIDRNVDAAEGLGVAADKIKTNIRNTMVGFENSFKKFGGVVNQATLGIPNAFANIFRKGLTGKSRFRELFMNEQMKEARIEVRKEGIGEEKFKGVETDANLNFFELLGRKAGNLLTLGMAGRQRKRLLAPIGGSKTESGDGDSTETDQTGDISPETETPSLGTIDKMQLKGIHELVGKIHTIMASGKQFAEENQTEQKRWQDNLLKAIQNIGKDGGAGVPKKDSKGGFFSNLFGKLFGGLFGGGIAAFSLPLLLRGIRKTVDGIFRIGTTFIRGIGSIIAEIFTLFKTAVVGIGEIVQSIINIIGKGFVSIMRFAGQGIKAFIMTIGSIPLPVLGIAAIAIGAISVQMLALGKALQMAAPFVEKVFDGVSKFAKAVGDSIAKILGPMADALVKISKISFFKLLSLPVFFFSLGGALLSFAATASWAIPALKAVGRASEGLTNLLDRTDKISRFASGMSKLAKTIKIFGQEVKEPFKQVLTFFDKLDDTTSFNKFLDLEIKKTELASNPVAAAGDLLRISRDYEMNQDQRGELLNSIASIMNNNTNVSNNVTNFNDIGVRQSTILSPPGVAD